MEDLSIGFSSLDTKGNLAALKKWVEQQKQLFLSYAGTPNEEGVADLKPIPPPIAAVNMILPSFEAMVWVLEDLEKRVETVEQK